MMIKVRMGSDSEVWAFLLAGLLVVVTLAGCVSDDDGQEGSGGDGANGDSGSGGDSGTSVSGTSNVASESGFEFPTLIHFGSCGLQTMQFHFPMEIAQDFVPQGFEPMAGDPAGLLAVMLVTSFECGNGTSSDFDVARHGEFRVSVAVEPPSGFSDSGGETYLVDLEAFVSNPEVQSVYANWGFWAMEGPVGFEVTEAGAARVGTASTDDGWIQYDLHTVVEASMMSCSDTTNVRVFPWSDKVRAYVDMELGPHCTGAGTGKVVIPEPPSTDPFDLVFLGLLSGTMTGPATQMWGDETSIVMEYVTV